jgi:CDP-glycerol glycerophosphotransferase
VSLPPRPRISVVVPVYDVAGYLPDCLDSILTQSVTDFEVVAVDDGSTDDSPAVLASYAARDARVRVVRQDNAGLGAARNTGVEHARGELLWFVDSDDLLAPGALELLLAPLLASGSDFATGNVWRLTSTGTVPARFLAPAFRRNRLRTHIRRFPELVADRVAWNKLFRRDFWDRHEFRFPTGVHYEDQYVTLPAHYLARSVDVVDRPVYLWRVREDGDRSITQQRGETRSMLDRVRAVAYVSDFLGANGWSRDKRRYDESAVTHDLRYFLEAFADADEGYRAAFLDAANGYLDTVDPRVFDALPAVRRVQWQLVRRRAAPELTGLLESERSGPGGVVAVRSGRRWVIDLPEALRSTHALPDRSLRVGRELRLVSELTELSVEADVVVRGRARADLLPGERVRGLRVVAVPVGPSRPVRLRTVADGAGFEARVPIARLGRRRGRWRLVVFGRVAGLRRVAVWHEREAGSPTSAAALGADGRETRLDLLGRGELRLTAGAVPPTVTSARVDQDVLEVSGPAGDVTGPAVRLVAEAGERGCELPAHVEASPAGRTFLARIPVRDLTDEAPGPWQLTLHVGGTAYRMAWSVPPVPVPSGPAASVAGPDGAGYARIAPSGEL